VPLINDDDDHKKSPDVGNLFTSKLDTNVSESAQDKSVLITTALSTGGWRNVYIFIFKHLYLQAKASV
jgi:hypothetical protein